MKLVLGGFTYNMASTSCTLNIFLLKYVLWCDFYVLGGEASFLQHKLGKMAVVPAHHADDG